MCACMLFVFAAALGITVAAVLLYSNEATTSRQLAGWNNAHDAGLQEMTLQPGAWLEAQLQAAQRIAEEQYNTFWSSIRLHCS